MTVKARFEPREDITPYELAVIVQKMRWPAVVCEFSREQWDGLPDGIRRHFTPEVQVGEGQSGGPSVHEQSAVGWWERIERWRRGLGARYA